MKIIKLVKKDLKLLRRDKKTLLMAIIVPIFILYLTGLIFGQSSSEGFKGSINVGLCNLDSEAQNNLPLGSFELKEIEGPNCDKDAELAVSKGKLKAVIIIPKGFSENIEQGHGSELRLIVDNSKPQTALVIVDSVKAAIQEINEKIGTEFINEAWKSLKLLNTNLKFVVANMQEAKESAIILQEKANALNKNLDRINETNIDLYLNDLNKSLSLLQTNITLYEDINRLKIIYAENCPLNLTETECNSINIAISNLQTAENSLQENQNKIKAFINVGNMSEMENQLTLVRTAKTQTKKDLVLLNSTLYNYTNNLINLITNLEKTSELLDIYTTRDPKNIVKAVTLEGQEIFPKRTYFNFIASGLILIILIFTLTLTVAANIVEERKKGTMARTLLSPTSIPTFIGSKAIYFLIFSIIEFLAMYLVLYYFNLELKISITALLILILAAINFIMLAVLIGAISNTENTALLSSLVITLPMFFLSDTFFPLEIMPNIIKVIGKNLPLTLGIQNLDRLLTYNTGVNYVSIIKLIIYPIILLILAYLAIKKKPT